MVAHCVKMLARDLGEPLIGHRQDTQSGSMGTHRRSKKRHRDSKNAHCPRTSLIANRTVVFATHSFLSFHKKPRMSSERRARLCAWRSAIVRHPRVAKDLLLSR